ncbi:MAG: PHP domain-containing protein [Deltaproteobacteria bacterium]|nr:PHP domain-containing protein [Deltaproteobacteria bacterium]
MSFKIDLHNHSTYSEDSTSEALESIERAMEVGLDGIAFTEHHSYTASEPVEKLKEKYKDRILILRGAEYSAAEGHLLLFGIKEDIFNDFGLHAPVDEVIRIVGGRGGVVIAPHPFREWSILRADIFKLKGLSAIEAYNGHNNEDENAKALRAAEVLSLPTTGGSDSHSRDEVGCCFTEFFDHVTEENFLDRIKAGNYRGACSG